jgi:hypothetical protein
MAVMRSLLAHLVSLRMALAAVVSVMSVMSVVFHLHSELCALGWTVMSVMSVISYLYPYRLSLSNLYRG